MGTHSLLIVGCGSIGERHLRCFQRTGRTQVRACDMNPALLKRMADTYNVLCESDWQAAVQRPDVDGVIICTPAPFHVPMALEALSRGINVLIEKPLSHSLHGVDALLAAIGPGRPHAAVAYVYHVIPHLAAAREYLRAADLGPVLQATITMGQPFQRLRPAYAQTYYRDHAMGGGAIQDALTHAVNWVESVIGPADSLVCDAAHQALPGVEVEDTVHVHARHGRVLASYALNQFQAPNESTFDFHTLKGSVRVELHRQCWGVFREGDTEWTWHPSAPGDRDAPFLAQANAFLDVLEGAPPRLCSVAAAVQTLRFNLAALSSRTTRTPVVIHDPAR